MVYHLMGLQVTIIYYFKDAYSNFAMGKCAEKTV